MFRPPSPQFQKRSLNPDNKPIVGYHQGPTRSLSGLSAYQQQLIARDSFQNSGKKEAQLSRNHSSLNPFEDKNKEGEQNRIFLLKTFMIRGSRQPAKKILQRGQTSSD